jgi:hypothetical protein
MHYSCVQIADGLGWYKDYLIVGNKTPSQSSRLEIPGIHFGGLGKLRKVTITGFCTARCLHGQITSSSMSPPAMT